jgi:hypothetical protein
MRRRGGARRGEGAKADAPTGRRATRQRRWGGAGQGGGTSRAPRDGAEALGRSGAACNRVEAEGMTVMARRIRVGPWPVAAAGRMQRARMASKSPESMSCGGDVGGSAWMERCGHLGAWVEAG